MSRDSASLLDVVNAVKRVLLFSDGLVELTSVNFSCPTPLLYEDVVFPENNPEDSDDN